jgi:predicted ATPase/DNA-binding winged helix-turn-helix (wHTH) protein
MMRYIFGEYTLDTDRDELRRNKAPLTLAPQAFKLLTYLLAHRDRTVTKEELHEQVWQSKYVAAAALTTCIAAVRQALEDRTHQLIKTVHRRGYRFTAPVREQPGETADAEGSGVADTLAPAEPSLPDRGEAGAERRQLTILACRVVGGADSAEPLDPDETLLDVLSDFQALCETVARQFEGHIARYGGEQLVVYFGYPWAHEDDARRAAYTGLGIVAGMAALNACCKRDGGGRLTVRVGIHTGMVVVRSAPREPLMLGGTSALATQVQDLALPDTVVISQATLRLVERDFLMESLGTYLLAGSSQPLAVFRVLQERHAPSLSEPVVPRGLTPLVGREHEVGLLLECWAQVQDGRGQVVLLSGDAGIGKSRLVQAFHEHLTEETYTYTKITWRCSPYYQQSAWYPVIASLHRLLQFRRADAPEEKLGKLERALEHAGLSLEEHVPLFAALLSLPLADRYPPLPLTLERQLEKIQEAVLEWLIEEAERRPICLVVEDLHWADPSTVEVLNRLIDHTPEAHLLLVLLFRPDFRPAWLLRPRLTQIALERLSHRLVEHMVEHMVGDIPLPAEVLQQIVAKTDGVPLFVEEVTKMVLESGLLKEREGQYELAGPLPPLAIPTTLHDLLMARLDRLGVAKEVAQLGSVVGREFAYEVLQAVAPMDETTLQQGLAQLVTAELLYQRGRPPRVQYIFKHGLIQEAAYQSMLQRTRQQYHRQIAQVLEDRFPAICESHPELLAHHYTAAGQSAQAIHYWQRAGQWAMAHSGYHEAVACLEQALVALQQLPERRDTLEQAIDLRLALRTPLHALRAFERLYEHLRLADTLAHTLADPGRQGWVAAYLSALRFNTGALEQALETGQRALAFAQGGGDLALEVVATYFLGLATYARGRYQQAVVLLRERLEDLTRGRSGESFGLPGPVAILARAWATRCLAEQGRFAEGQALGYEALRLAEEATHPFALARAAEELGVLYLRQGVHSQATAMLERSHRLCQDWHLTLRLPSLTVYLGYAYTLAGRTTDALPLLEHAVAQMATMPNQLAHELVLLSEAILLAGRWEAAAPLAEQALALARTHQEAGTEAWALRLCGELAAQPGPHAAAAAEARYLQALALADALGMRPLLAHIHLGLGTLYHQSGRRGEAGTELALAVELFRALEMPLWLSRAEAARAVIGGMGRKEMDPPLQHGFDESA